MTLPAQTTSDHHPNRWRILSLLAIAELLGMSLWFAASAVSPQLAQRWSLSTNETAWLTTIVQLGFVCGTAVAAVLNLADVIPSHRFFAASAFLGPPPTPWCCSAAVSRRPSVFDS